MIDDLLLFTRVIEQKSFTKAAKVENTTVSRVSKRIQFLEKKLQTKLMHRSTRQLSLTQAGQVLYEKCQHLNDYIYQSIEEALTPHKTAIGALKISVPISLGHQLITPLIKLFHEQYPNISLNIVYQNRHINIVEEGYDLAILCGRPMQELQIVKKIGVWTHILCASSQYCQKYGQPKNIRELIKHPCLLRSHGDVIESTWNLTNKVTNKTQSIHINSKNSITVNSPNDLKSLVLDDLGIAMMAEYLIQDDIIKGRLQPILEDYYDLGGGVFFELPNNQYIPTKTRLFMNFIENNISHYFDEGLS